MTNPKYKLVPVEPTEAMVKAMAVQSTKITSYFGTGEGAEQQIYQSAIQAAPEPPESRADLLDTFIDELEREDFEGCVESLDDKVVSADMVDANGDASHAASIPRELFDWPIQPGSLFKMSAGILISQLPSAAPEPPVDQSKRDELINELCAYVQAIADKENLSRIEWHKGFEGIAAKALALASINGDSNDR